jgi:uncharacterized metal-binding protein
MGARKNRNSTAADRPSADEVAGVAPLATRVGQGEDCPAPPLEIEVHMSEIAEPERSTPVVIYSCSGCSDAGELADRTARILSQQKLGEMSCLAGIGGRVKPLLLKAEKARHLLAIDGCPLNCARHTLEQAGFQVVHHLELHKLGLRKGSCPPTAERLAVAVHAGAELIQTLENGPRT